MPDFVPGLNLSEQFFHEVVQPLLGANFPDLPYSAALIGAGSDILEFDDEMSSDHDWAPRVMLFIREGDNAELGDSMREVLSRKLPRRFRGYSTAFANSIHQSGEVLTLRSFIADSLKFDIDCDIQTADWLTFPQHSLREVTSGMVYHDGIGLQEVRDRFSYYPYEVWLYLLLASWARIAEEQHLMGRAGFVNDELGSSIMGSRLVREVMRLCFLMEKQYMPYPKWFGTAFSHLVCSQDLTPVLLRVQLAETWHERETYLCAALECVGAMHDALNITEPLSAPAHQFFDRPFQVVDVAGFVEAIRACITDTELKRLAGDQLFGSIDHISDNPNFLMHGPDLRAKLRKLYE